MLETQGLTDTAILDIFPHNEHIDLRLQLCKYMALESSLMLSKENLQTIWGEVITNNPLVGDHSIVYNWLRSLLNEMLKNSTDRLVNEKSLIEFFKVQIQSGSSDYTNLSI